MSSNKYLEKVANSVACKGKVDTSVKPGKMKGFGGTHKYHQHSDEAIMKALSRSIQPNKQGIK